MEDFCEGCKFSWQDETDVVLKTSALISAVQNRHEKCLKLLINEGADVNAVGPFCRSALLEAVESGREGCLQTLIEAGADVNLTKNGKPVLIEAARFGNEEFVTLLISAGADVNVRNKFGNTALIAAVKFGNDECVNRLLEAGADVNASVSGVTPLHIAVDKGSASVESLIRAGANVNAATHAGMTALMFAARNEDEDQVAEVDLLLKSGADVNARDINGDTALLMAASAGNKDCVKRLLKAGAYVNKIQIDFNEANDSYSYATRTQSKPLSCELLKLMFVAGINGTDYRMLRRIADLMNEAKISMEDLRRQTSRNVCLMNCCRTTIRQHLKQLSPPTNLFVKIPQLGLPTLLADYLLYNMSLDEEQ